MAVSYQLDSKSLIKKTNISSVTQDQKLFADNHLFQLQFFIDNCEVDLVPFNHQVKPVSSPLVIFVPDSVGDLSYYQELMFGLTDCHVLGAVFNFFNGTSNLKNQSTLLKSDSYQNYHVNENTLTHLAKLLVQSVEAKDLFYQDIVLVGAGVGGVIAREACRYFSLPNKLALMIDSCIGECAKVVYGCHSSERSELDIGKLQEVVLLEYSRRLQRTPQQLAKLLRFSQLEDRFAYLVEILKLNGADLSEQQLFSGFQSHFNNVKSLFSYPSLSGVDGVEGEVSEHSQTQLWISAQFNQRSKSSRLGWMSTFGLKTQELDCHVSNPVFVQALAAEIMTLLKM